MAVVDDVPLALGQVFAQDGAEGGHEQHALARDLVHEQALAGEHGLAEGLGLVLLGHAGGAGEEGVAADGPLLRAGEAQEGEVAERVGGEEEFAGSGEGAVGEFGADEDFLEGELHGAAEGDCGGHCDHDACGENG